MDPTTQWKKDAVSRADHVICISENTRRDLVEMFGVAETKVSVVYLGYDELATSGKEPEAVAAVTSSCPYLLYVGTRGGYKNFEGLLRAYASSGFLRDNFSLVTFGDGPFRGEENLLIKELGLSNGQVKQIGGEDNVLGHLYKGAAAFVYPSLYEGFGIPPLEAMSIGCPVICSNTSSLPEVVGNAGEYFDPGSIESIRTALETVLQSTTRRDDLIKMGHMRSASFSWARCADETLAIYRSLI
jgi:glycosyltransferase involved in cell wall biosynthesis